MHPRPGQPGSGQSPQHPAQCASSPHPSQVACLRTLLPEIVADADLLHTAYAFDASANEATWVGGPPLGLAVGALWSPGAALAVGGGMLLFGTVAFAAQPASRRFCAAVGE